MASREIVHKKQGFRSAYGNVVDTHSDEVDTDCVVPVHQESDLQFGTDPISTAYPHWILILFAFQAEEATKPPEIRQNLRPEGRADERLDAVDEFVSGVHVYAGFPIGGHSRARILAEGLEGGQTIVARTFETVLAPRPVRPKLRTGREKREYGAYVHRLPKVIRARTLTPVVIRTHGEIVSHGSDNAWEVFLRHAGVRSPYVGIAVRPSSYEY